MGAFAPFLRILLHTGFVFILASLVQILSVRINHSEKSALSLLLLSLCIYLLSLLAAQYLLPAVSDPGGPRSHRIQRQPQWDDRSIAPPACITKWRCAIAEESHAITQTAFGGEAVLTGEASGRDIWTTEPHREKQKAIDEALVNELASGGRSSSSSGTNNFNPSVNPNRYVTATMQIYAVRVVFKSSQQFLFFPKVPIFTIERN